MTEDLQARSVAITGLDGATALLPNKLPVSFWEHHCIGTIIPVHLGCYPLLGGFDSTDLPGLIPDTVLHAVNHVDNEQAVLAPTVRKHSLLSAPG